MQLDSIHAHIVAGATGSCLPLIHRVGRESCNHRVREIGSQASGCQWHLSWTCCCVRPRMQRSAWHAQAVRTHQKNPHRAVQRIAVAAGFAYEPVMIAHNRLLTLVQRCRVPTKHANQGQMPPILLRHRKCHPSTLPPGSGSSWVLASIASCLLWVEERPGRPRLYAGARRLGSPLHLLCCWAAVLDWQLIHHSLLWLL